MVLFDHYPADPAAIEGVAGDAGRHAGTVSTVGSQVSTRSSLATCAVSGDLASPMAAAPRPVRSSSHQIAGAALVTQGCLTRWARAVRTYNSGIDALNSRYAAARATSFGVDADQFFLHGAGRTVDQRAAAFDAALARSDAALRASLATERARLEDELDAEAVCVGGMLDEGPTEQVATTLVQAGDLPADPNLWGEIWTGVRGQVIPPLALGPWGVGGWTLGRAGTAFGFTSSWMTRVHLGRFAPRNALGQYMRVPTSQVQVARLAMSSRNWQAKPYASATRGSWATAGKWAGRAGTVISVATGALSQWQEDQANPDLTTTARVGRAATRGAVAGAAGWAGAWAGAQLGAGIGTAIGGPVGTVVGGFVGGVVGGVIGSGIGNEIADHVVDFAGDAADKAADLADDAVEGVKDAAGAVGSFLGF